MDVIEALNKTATLWTYLAKHPYASKQDAYRVLHLTTDLNDCPCCQFARFETKRGPAVDCSICPLKYLWPQGCCKYDSPYGVWMSYRNTPGGSRSANQIVRAALTRIKDLRIQE